MFWKKIWMTAKPQEIISIRWGNTWPLAGPSPRRPWSQRSNPSPRVEPWTEKETALNAHVRQGLPDFGEAANLWAAGEHIG